MYEKKTYENIMEEMLKRVRNDVDKREGSVIWDAIAAVAYSLAEMYFELEHYPNLLLPDTAVGEYLDRFVAAFHLKRKAAVKAVRVVESAEVLAVGSRWQIQDVSYAITAKAGENRYFAQCEQAGQVGNQYYGEMVSLSGISNASVKIGAVHISGADAESDEALRERFFARVQRPSTSGNVNDYYNWAMECTGVGAAKIFPLNAGPGTVAIVVVDEEKRAADPNLLNRVREHIEQLRPIGAEVIVDTAAEKEVNVSARVKLSAGVNLAVVQQDFQKAAAAYLQENAFEVGYVSAARLGNLLIAVAGVEDYAGLCLNGTAENVPVAEKEVAVLGTVRLEVMTDGS